MANLFFRVLAGVAGLLAGTTVMSAAWPEPDSFTWFGLIWVILGSCFICGTVWTVAHNNLVGTPARRSRPTHR